MTPTAYYNEIDPFAASWIRNLVDAGHVAHGVVDERSISDLTPDDVAGSGQRHFFAGIAGWSYALRLAGWPDDLDVWTGSCPCQPFSAAGRRKGTDDARHLWPSWFALIAQCRPAVVFGEQVASPDGLKWLDLVRADLEGAGYAFAASDLCAAGVGAPHIRQRLYFAALADRQRLEGIGVQLRERGSLAPVPEARGSGAPRFLADTDGPRRGAGGSSETGDGRDAPWIEPAGLRATGSVGDTGIIGLEGRQQTGPEETATRGPWAPADWLACRDERWRPVEPSTFPVAHGVPARVGRLRGYGNAIVPQLAATFIQAVTEALWL